MQGFDKVPAGYECKLPFVFKLEGQPSMSHDVVWNRKADSGEVHKVYKDFLICLASFLLDPLPLQHDKLSTFEHCTSSRVSKGGHKQGACMLLRQGFYADSEGRPKVATGSTKEGQTVFEYVARIVCVARYGMPKEEQVACHSPWCTHRPACINPEHLRWGSKAENNHDKVVQRELCSQARRVAASVGKGCGTAAKSASKEVCINRECKALAAGMPLRQPQFGSPCRVLRPRKGV